MKRLSKATIKKSLSGIKNYIYIVPVVVPIYIIYSSVVDIDLLEFPYDNVRYAYSAIFQGFAAILAIMITAILITLQNIHTQRFSIEERIYKILDDRYPEYVPKTLKQIEKYVRSKKFADDLWRFLANKAYSPSGGSPLDEKIPGYDERGISSPPYVVKRIADELRRKFDFLGEQRKHEKQLRKIFVVSLGLIIVVIIYSLTALILVPSNPSETQSSLFIINPIHALIICAFLVFLALMVVMQFMMRILNVWKLKAE